MILNHQQTKDFFNELRVTINYVEELEKSGMTVLAFRGLQLEKKIDICIVYLNGDAIEVVVQALTTEYMVSGNSVGFWNEIYGTGYCEVASSLEEAMKMLEEGNETDTIEYLKSVYVPNTEFINTGGNIMWTVFHQENKVYCIVDSLGFSIYSEDDFQKIDDDDSYYDKCLYHYDLEDEELQEIAEGFVLSDLERGLMSRLVTTNELNHKLYFG